MGPALVRRFDAAQARPHCPNKTQPHRVSRDYKPTERLRRRWPRPPLNATCTSRIIPHLPSIARRSETHQRDRLGDHDNPVAVVRDAQVKVRIFRALRRLRAEQRVCGVVRPDGRTLARHEPRRSPRIHASRRPGSTCSLQSRTKLSASGLARSHYRLRAESAKAHLGPIDENRFACGGAPQLHLFPRESSFDGRDLAQNQPPDQAVHSVLAESELADSLPFFSICLKFERFGPLALARTPLRAVEAPSLYSTRVFPYPTEVVVV